jgi:hypothetical protein
MILLFNEIFNDISYGKMINETLYRQSFRNPFLRYHL